MFFSIASVIIGQLYDNPIASELTLTDVDKLSSTDWNPLTNMVDLDK